MGQSLAQPLFLSRRFQDLDDLRNTVRAWDFDLIQLERGKFRASVLQVIGVDCQFSHFHFDRHVHQRGGTPPGVRTFGIPSRTCTEVTWLHREVRPDEILVFPIGQEFDATSRQGFEGFSLSFSEEFLAREAEHLGIAELAHVPVRSATLRCDPARLSAFRSWLSCASAELNSRGSSCRQHREFERELAGGFFSLVSTDRRHETDRLPGSAFRGRALRQALEYIEACPEEALTVRELCAVAEVSERALQYAFLEQLGVPPKAYMRALRLNRVRSELVRSSSRSTKICDVAGQWGFWHMGQFAADYRRLFGEKPSETLRRA